MFKRLMLLGVSSVAAVALSACVSTSTPVVSRYPDQPIFAWVESKYVDDDSPPQYTLRFRNTGSQIVSFDYTVADQLGVPHIDRDGPNSGFVGNHYPGAEVEVPNPLKKQRVYVTLGTLRYGKKLNIPRQRPAPELSLAPSEGPTLPVEPAPLPAP